MYCRTCGNKMNDNAEICVKCGVRRNVGTAYCQVCGSQTTATMTNCKKCGAKLMRAMSTAQLKKTATTKAKKGKRKLGKVLFAIGVIFWIAVAINIIVLFFDPRADFVIGLPLFGGLFTAFGRYLKK